MELLSFKNDQAIKDFYIKRVEDHYKADEIIKGRYWENGKGCAVGCILHSSDHKAFEHEIALPEWLALLIDKIFEGLPNDKAKEFPLEFIKSVPVGKNLDKVKWRFCAFILKKNIETVLALDIDEELKKQVISSTRQVLQVHEKAIVDNLWDVSTAEFAALAAESAALAAESAAWAAWSAAESAAQSAALAAWSAAESAAQSAALAAESAAESAAQSAALAAWSAAESAAQSAALAAWSAAQSAARSAAYEIYATELLRLLKEVD